MFDSIEICRLKITTHIGVPVEERADPQYLLVTVKMTPLENFDNLADEIIRTIDYHAVSLEIGALAACKPRHLIETLATDIANYLLERHLIAKIFVRIEKHILSNTECVAVEILRSRR